jgi:hypothetical protein
MLERCDVSHFYFVEGYKAGHIRAHVDLSRAMHVCDRHPALSKSQRFAHNFWKNVGCLIPIVGLAGFFFIGWYSLAIILVAPMLVFPAVRRSAGDFVLETALIDDAFYYQMLQAEVLTLSYRS